MFAGAAICGYGRQRLVNKKIARNLPGIMNRLLRRNAYHVAAAKEAAREEVTESLKGIAASPAQRYKDRRIAVRSLSGVEKYFDVPRWPEEPLTQWEFFQSVRRRFDIPTDPTPISICLLFLGRQAGCEQDRERWDMNAAMQCRSDWAVPESMRGTIWQLVIHR